MESLNNFPVLDFSKFVSDFDTLADEVFAASSSWGFFVLTNHGVPDINNMYSLSNEFFNLPQEQKAEKILDDTLTGYDGTKLTTFAASEGISFGLPAGFVLKSENLPSWWDQAKRKNIENFKASCYQLSLDLMSCFAVKLGLPKSHFSAHHEHRDPGNVLKFIKYPRFEEQPGNVPRLSEHTDWGSLTFVFTETPGLEIRDPSNQWYDIPVVPGGVVVNIGDALSLWSNQSLKSTMHRISWKNLDIKQDRQSVVYFVHPNSDTNLTSEKEASTASTLTSLTYKEYREIRLALTYSSIRDKDQGFKNIDADVLKRVKKLNVANAGLLESHELRSGA